MEQSRPNKLCQWNQEDMAKAYKAAKLGQMTIAQASKTYNIPRMTLSDRVKWKISVDAKMGASTVLTLEDEIALVNYIEYMAQRGFPLSVSQVIGFAWCIAKEHPGSRVFSETGPTEKWWRGFKKRHPEISLRRPDALDRGRAAMGNVAKMKDYFKLLKSTLEANDLKDNPERIYNCDEAGLSLNKCSGQRVVVPKRFKHAHSISIATSEHILVHCCVNAAGNTLPPMIIFSGGYPGGAYHKNGPINATYATTDSGFMDKETYFQWFEKVFLRYCVKERPILLLQDGAVSHISPMLIDSALKNDIILLCLPSKTTHILQPLDVAVYKNMKTETTKQISHAKMLKSDLWVSKKNVSSIFKVIFERSLTMACITQGFRKCGIHPFDPNAIDKTLLFMGGSDINPDKLDLSLFDETTVSTNETESVSDVLTMSGTANNETDNLVGVMQSTGNTEVTTVMELEVGVDGILSPIISNSIETSMSFNDTTSSNLTACPPELALSAIESALTLRKKRKYENAFSSKIDVKGDVVFNTWRQLKMSCSSFSNTPPELNAANDSIDSTPSSSLSIHPSHCPEPQYHPLVKAGLIPDDLVSVLVVPQTKDISGRTKRRKTDGKARILSTKEVQEELDSKERKKNEEEKNKIKRKEIREKRKSEKSIEEENRKLKQEQMKKMRELKQIKSKTAKNERQLKKAKAFADFCPCLVCLLSVTESDVPFMCSSCSRVFHAHCIPTYISIVACPFCY